MAVRETPGGNLYAMLVAGIAAPDLDLRIAGEARPQQGADQQVAPEQEMIGEDGAFLAVQNRKVGRRSTARRAEQRTSFGGKHRIVVAEKQPATDGVGSRYAAPLF